VQLEQPLPRQFTALLGFNDNGCLWLHSHSLFP
jgi:hypothetical protein